MPMAPHDALHVDPSLDVDPGSVEAMPPGQFEVLAKVGDARAGRLHTAHGPVDTPCFMPVGTYGSVKGLSCDELKGIGSQVVLANAYHLTHRPGADDVAALGGLHRLMDWDRAILTDSGGYQVFSLRQLQKIDEGGVNYQTHFDGSRHRMTPESVLETQAKLGSDICMILDHCPPGDASRTELLDAMQRTTRWAEQAARARGSILGSRQLCFAIVQGGTDLQLRAEHVKALTALEFDGFALGGLSVGEPVPAMHATMAAVAPTLPEQKPRYVMGIGTPHDLLAAIRSGVDMFDCVIPTRHARNGQLLTWAGKLNIRQARFRLDKAPIDPGCGCFACARYSRAALRHLHLHQDPLYVRLASLHNIFFLHQLVAVLRRAIRRGDFETLADAVFERISDGYGVPGEKRPPLTGAEEATSAGGAPSA